MKKKNDKKIKYPRVRIEWWDIQQSEEAWMHEDEINKEDVAYCVDEGYLYKRTRDKVWLFSSYSINDNGTLDCGNVNVFPRGCVKKITKL